MGPGAKTLRWVPVEWADQRIKARTLLKARRTIVLTTLAMFAFAANSILCRVALERTAIDPASFTAIRLLAGAGMLWILVRLRGGDAKGVGNWASAFALFVYAAGFSFAYVSLTAATGALLLFGAVQITMMAQGLRAGERLSMPQVSGYLLALAGLVGLLLPGLSAPPPGAAALMITAGIAWGVYSLRGKGQGDATGVTAGNFLRAAPFALVLMLVMHRDLSTANAGVGYAVVSGALTSGIGYVIWYSALRILKATTAATVQLSGPLIVALGGAAMLAEPVSLRWALASVAILGGIALVILKGASAKGNACDTPGRPEPD